MARRIKVAESSGDEWVLDVLGNPFDGPNDGRDADGEYFAADTRYHEDKWPLPPAVYYHGLTESGKPDGEPQYIGKTVQRWVDQAGVWYRVVLDKANSLAERVWQAAKDGIARASTGSAAHLVRTDPDGHIREWPVVELSIFDAVGRRQPANAYAVAVPAAKAVWQRAGIDLPDDIDNPATHEAEPEESVAADSASAEEPPSVTVKTGETEMAEEQKVDVGALVAEQVAAALKAERERQEAERAEQERIEQIKAEAVSAAKAEWDKTVANRLPMYEAPYVTKFGDSKYDNLDASDMAFMIGALKAHNKPVSDLAYKSLALKCAEAKDHEPSARATKALHTAAGKALKSDEIMQSDLSNYGDEWVGVQYSNQLWESVRAQSWVVDRLPKIEVPPGHESVVIPLEAADPTYYKVSQAADEQASGWPNATVTSSQAGTDNQTLTLAKMGARVLWSGEMEEDSLVPFANELRRKLERSGAEQLEHVVIDGDTTTSASTNINDIAGTPGGTESFLLVDGFRKLALVTNTANSRDAGTLTEDDYLETVKLLGGAGKYALESAKVTLIPDVNTYWKSLALASVKTKDVWEQATLRDGKLVELWGFELRPSAFMHFDPSGTITGAYELKANSAGKLDLDTTTNNSTGAILAVRWDQWRFGWRRRMTLETTRIARADTTEIVALMRFGLIYRDNDAAAISYNITL
jgi:hypothetical protein